MRTSLIAKAVVFDAAGNVLLLRRSATDTRRPGEQDFPGGGIEDGEEYRAAVCREIFEEAGLSVAVGNVHLFYAASEIYRDTNITRLLFWTRVQDAAVQLSFEHDEYQWVTPEEALRLFPHPMYGTGLAYGLKHGIFVA
ncbi:MAG TPA: NUDIX hydrolase [Candidatus Saccharimonadales bacterium]|jgi:8-oxo-dGTP diphosphatase